MSKDFDTSDIDQKRIEAIDREVSERNSNLTPTPDYGWEVDRRHKEELEQQLQHWYSEATRYREALEKIMNIYPHTSVAGDLMTALAAAALGRSYRGLGRE